MAERPGKSNGTARLEQNTELRTPLPFSATPRRLWNSHDSNGLELVASSFANFNFFDDIMFVRDRTDERWPEQRTPVDEYSDHYCMYAHGKPVGCLGVTRALHGNIFLQEFYPEVLFDRYFDRIASAYRFRLLAEYRKTSPLVSEAGIARVLTREVWREQIAKGVGLDLINVEKHYVAYYQRMGYVLAEGYDFRCPIFNEMVSVMFLPSDPSRRSILQDLAEGRDDVLYLEEVQRTLSTTQVAVPRTLRLA